MLGLEELDVDTIFDEYKVYAKEIKKYVCDTSLLIEEEIEKVHNIIFEINVQLIRVTETCLLYNKLIIIPKKYFKHHNF